MGLSESFSNIYAKIEDSFYGALDFLESKGIPVYKVVNPIEERGIPFFPVFALILMIGAVLAYGFFSASATPINVVLSFKDTEGNPVTGVQLVAKDSGGRILDLGSSSFVDGQNVDWEGIGSGQRITFTASKEGYESVSPQTITVKPGRNDVPLLLRRDNTLVVGRMRLVDSGTGDPVRNATVVASLADATTITCSEESDGVYACIGVNQGDEVSVQVKSAAYEDLQFNTSFSEGSVTEQQLAPKAAALAGVRSLVITVIDEATGQRISGATIRVFDSQTNQL